VSPAKPLRFRAFLGWLALASLVASGPSAAQWAASAGDTVRDEFGPLKGLSAPVCRGACGMDCPDSCDADVRFECAGNDTLLRVKTYRCGTHQGCRDHDDCLDRCVQQHGAGYDCEAECHAEAVGIWGLEMATSWAMGGPPHDGDPILFEYTKDSPTGPVATYVCPEGADLQCSSGEGRCRESGQFVEPVFSTFAGATAVQVSGFRSGRVCTYGGQPTGVCQPTVEIQVAGKDRCLQPGGERPCTWYGFEMDYRNANPAEPLICQSTGDGEGDFLGDLLGSAIKSAPPAEESDNEGMNELGRLFGAIQQELQSGKSMDQAFSGITITTADGQVLGGPSPEDSFPQAGVPTEVRLPGASGHLLVPMFELADSSPQGTRLERRVRCLQGGQPVIETTFRLNFAGY